jgi:hypothetical protein
MQTINARLPQALPASEFIFNLPEAALAGVPFHKDSFFITRYCAEHFPFHLAVHEISPVFNPPEEYTKLHQHDDCNEVNIIISPTNILYKIVLGSEEYTVPANSAIWIPRGMLHSANVLEGSGFFITMRMP